MVIKSEIFKKGTLVLVHQDRCQWDKEFNGPIVLSKKNIGRVMEGVEIGENELGYQKFLYKIELLCGDMVTIETDDCYATHIDKTRIWELDKITSDFSSELDRHRKIVSRYEENLRFLEDMDK